MATVRITDSLKAEIDYKIRQQFQTRRIPIDAKLNAVVTPTREFTNAIAGAIRDMHSTSESDLEKVPAWLNRVTSVSVYSLNGVDMPYRLRTVRLTAPIPWPMNSTQDLTNPKSPRLARWATDLKVAVDELEKLNAEEEAFRKQVSKLLGSCSTYKQALEIWPQLTSVTPSHIISRHEEKVTRQQREEIKVDLDTDALNMTAVVNTIAAAQKSND